MSQANLNETATTRDGGARWIYRIGGLAALLSVLVMPVSIIRVLGLHIPVTGIWVSILSVLGLAVWHLQIGRRLLRLAGSVSGQGVRPLEEVL